MIANILFFMRISTTPTEIGRLMLSRPIQSIQLCQMASSGAGVASPAAGVGVIWAYSVRGASSE